MQSDTYPTPVFIDGRDAAPTTDRYGGRVQVAYHAALALDAGLEMKVMGLSDWKGTLTVLWNYYPSFAELGAVDRGWSTVHESYDQVVHWVLYDKDGNEALAQVALDSYGQRCTYRGYEDNEFAKKLVDEHKAAQVRARMGLR